MNDDLRKQFTEAVKVRETGDLVSAKLILSGLAEQEPNSVAILATLGHTCLDLHELEEAVNLFRRATQLSPALEAVSLGLFHSLWRLGNKVEALEEAKRFQSIADSEDYREIINEINEKW